jgi:hypothetical protein
MKLKDIQDVLTFRSFRPEPDDSTAPWRKRFPRERTLLLGISRRRVNWLSLDRRGDFTDPGSMEGDLKEVLGAVGPDLRAQTENGWCAVSLNHRFVITLEVNLSRRAGLEEQLRSNPKAALGAKAERGKRYSLIHNPESNTSLLLAVDEDAIVKTEMMLREQGLQPGRISIGIYGMLLDLISQVAEARMARAASNPGEPFGNMVMVACCEGSVVVLSQREEQWTELRSRSDLYTDDLTPVLDILMPLLQNAGPGAHVIFMNDEQGSNFAELLEARAPGTQLSEVTAPQQLAKLLTDQ